MTWLPFAVVGLALAVVIVLGYVLGWRWTGVAEVRRTKTDGEDVRPAKTLWDWLQLLVIPVALAVLAVLLNNWQTDREQEREDRREELQRAAAGDAAREEALRAYFMQMSELILNRRLLGAQKSPKVRAVARTITLTVLRRLDGEGKGSVLRFLSEAHLVNGRPAVELQGADLRSADLRRADLTKAVLVQADLTGADLRRAYLHTANLGETDLTGADLERAAIGEAWLGEADLRGADLRRAGASGASFLDADLRGAYLSDTVLGHADLVEADLRRADLRRADLRAADLRRADLQAADLRGVELRGVHATKPGLTGTDLRGANLRSADLRGAAYDYTTRWPSGFDPVAAGAREFD